MVGWHPRHRGHEFEQALGDSEGQGSLACLQSMGLLDTNNVPLKSPAVRSTRGDHIEYVMLSEGNTAEQSQETVIKNKMGKRETCFLPS